MQSDNNAVYLELFTCQSDVEQRFDIDLSDQEEIILAYYEMDWYDGRAYVLYKKDDKLYEVVGSHCSCYGLEGQWCPEETSLGYLQHVLDNGWVFNSFKPAMEEALKNIIGVQ